MPPDYQQIIVFLPNWLGDAVMATPALRALRRHCPAATITAVGKSSVCEMLRGGSYMDDFVAIPSRPGAIATLQLGRSLRTRQPDLAVVFPNSFRTAWMAWLTRAPRRVGYHRGGRGILLTDAVARYTEAGTRVPRYTALDYLHLVKHLGARRDEQGLELAVPQEARDAVAARLDPSRPVVGIAPGAAFGPSKRWLPERYAAVADALVRECNAQCVLLTGPGEEDTRDAVIRAAASTFSACYDSPGSIPQLKAAISCLDLLIANDSGPRHIAIAFDVPVVCVMGSTSPKYTDSPWERGEVVRIDVDCGPCQRPYCVTDHRCMTGISVERVVEAARRHLPRAT